MSDGTHVAKALWGGFSAKHYMLDHMNHKEMYDKIYPTPKEVIPILSKFKRHYKIPFTYEFTGIRGGVAYSRRCHIELPSSNIRLGTVCHEVAHLLADKKWGYGVHHNKKFQTQMNRTCRWAKKFLDVVDTATQDPLKATEDMPCFVSKGGTTRQVSQAEFFAIIRADEVARKNQNNLSCFEIPNN